MGQGWNTRSHTVPGRNVSRVGTTKGVYFPSWKYVVDAMITEGFSLTGVIFSFACCSDHVCKGSQLNDQLAMLFEVALYKYSMQEDWVH